MRRWLPILVVGALGISACAGDDGAGPEPTSTTAVPETTPARLAGPATTEPSPDQTPEIDDPAADDLAADDLGEPGSEPPADDLDGSGEYPEQPDRVAWPTLDWSIGDLPDNVDPGAIDAVVDAAFGAPDQTSSVRSVLAVHGGQLVYERYHPLDGPESLFASFSVAKSVTAALFGIAVREGLVEVDEPTGLVEWAEDARSEITIDHLLRMSSGLEWTETYGPGSDPLMMLASPRAADVPIAKPLVAEPGTTFIDDRLLQPLGISEVNLLTDSEGVFVGGLGFDTTARDFARFGLLHLRGGVWDGQRLLGEDWLDDVRMPSATQSNFGGHWWLRGDPESFVAQGLFGQQVLVVPDMDLVLVVTSAPGSDPGPVTSVFLEQFAGIG